MAAAITASAIAYGQSPVSDGEAEGSPAVPVIDEVPQAGFVELTSPPTVEKVTVSAALEEEEARFHAAASRSNIQYAESRHFRTLWNGLGSPD